MMAEGVMLMNVGDVMKAFGVTEHQGRGVGDSSYMDSLRRVTDSSPLRTFAYKKSGPGQKRYTGYMLPGIIGGEATLRTWLETKLGPLASLTVERVKVRDSAAAQAMFAKIGRDALGRATLPLARFRETLKAIDDFFAAIGEDGDDERESEATPGTT